MNIKDKLIRKLLDVGKKHRILVYPTLILVAIISAISHTVYWGKGNGKRLVASVAIVALLITQSLFLTSSALEDGEEPSASTEQEIGENVETPEDNESLDPAYNGDNNVIDPSDSGQADDQAIQTVDDLQDVPSADDDQDDNSNTDDNNSVNDDNDLSENTSNDNLDTDDESAIDSITDDLNTDDGDSGFTLAAYYVVYSTTSSGSVVDNVAGRNIGEDGKVDLSSDIVTSNWGAYGSDAGINLSGPYYTADCTSAIPADSVADSWVDNNGTYSGDTVNVYFKATRTSYVVKLESEGSVVYTSSPIAVSPASDVIDTPLEGYEVLSAAGYGNISRKGYIFNGVTYGSHYDIGSEITLSPSSGMTLTADWTAKKFNINCNVNADGTYVVLNGTEDNIEVECTYDSGIELPSDVSSYATSKGYKLVAWTDGTNTYPVSTPLTAEQVNALAIDDSDDESGISDTGKTLTAVWEYRNINLVLNNTGSGTVSDDTLTAEYGDDISLSISAEYKDKAATNNNFSYEIISGLDAITALGLNVSTTTSGGKTTGYTINGTFSDISTGATIVIKITDENQDTSGSEESETRSITFVSNKKKVTMDADSVKDATGNAISKTYDGKTAISTTGRCDIMTKVGTDDVYATFKEAAELETPDAGTGKAVILENVNLAGAKADKYILVNNDVEVPENGTVTLDGVAEVIRAIIPVEIKKVDESASDTVLFGEDTPEYTLIISDDSKLSSEDKERYSNSGTDSARMTFMENVLGFTGWDCARNIYSAVNTNPGYTIKPVFASSDKNYAVEAPSATFYVDRDAGEGHYEFDRTAVNDIYPGLVIKPIDGYNQIRIVSDGADISESMTRSAAEALFSNSVSIDDGMDQTIIIQMYNTETGAVTKMVTLEHINVDSKGPKLDSFTVSPSKTYINDVGFGSYYHAQIIDGKKVESISIDFVYSADDSECKTLYYTFTDVNGNVLSSGTKEMKKKDGTTNKYEASVTIGTGIYGKLMVSADNKAGIMSAPSYITLNDAITDLDDYYEWMVENTITGSDIIVTDSEGTTASSGIWYNSLSYETTATDEESGLQYIDWKIKDPNGTVTTINESAGYELAKTKTDYGKVISYTFSGSLNDENTVGEYIISATLYDNAGNSIDLESKGPFLLDCKAPVITDNTSYAVTGYNNVIDFTFTAVEGSEESGIASVKLYKDGEEQPLKSWSKASDDTYTYEISENGTYIIEAKDNAGNVKTYEKEITNLSTEIPETPVITVTGTQGNGRWYIKESPSVNIKSQETTENDNIPVRTYYTVTVGNNSTQNTTTSGDYNFNLNSERGEVIIKAWSESYSGIKSEEATKTIYVDTVKPDLYITESTVDDDGNIVINFKSTDDISGVNTSKVLVNGNPITVNDNDGVITGSFSSTTANTFEIVTEDIAGNVSDTIDFAPMRLSVSPVTDIQETSAYLNSDIYQGTYEISECYIQYKKSTDSTYDTCLSNKTDTSYGKNMDYTFRNLTPDTQYDYKVYASTKTSKEVKTYEGSFRTSSMDATGVIKGSAKYGSELSDGYDRYPIYVSLYDGNTFIKSVKLESESDEEYRFNDVSDGTYRIVASDGFLTEETSVIVEKGGITYPTTYATDGGINFVLDGLSTEVVLKDNTVALTVDGLEKIYNTGLYKGNVTDADLDVVAQGGSIKITLYASYMDVSSVGDTTETIFEDKLGNTAIIERYIDLEIVKEVRNAEGDLVNGTPTNITRLAEPVTLSFPLGSLSGKNIHVASLHGSDSNYTFKSWVNGTEAVLSTNYVTITTDRFSVYALYRYVESEKTYTVKWLDGDGKVMKTETVKSGSAATPPTATPTKTASDKYTYVFEGWDTDYSAITKDTIISAWFTAKKKSTDDPSDKPSDDPSDKPSDDPSDKPSDNPENNPETTVTPSDSKNNNGVDAITSEPVRYTYMGSADSPKTGDATPIALAMLVMVSSSVGIFAIRKKAKKNQE